LASMNNSFEEDLVGILEAMKEERLEYPAGRE
jgi:hypothetical protein